MIGKRGFKARVGMVLLVILAMVCSLASAQLMQVNTAYGTVNVYQAPNQSGTVFRTVEPGLLVNVNSTSSDGQWVQVSFNNQQAWMLASQLSAPQVDRLYVMPQANGLAHTASGYADLYAPRGDMLSSMAVQHAANVSAQQEIADIQKRLPGGTASNRQVSGRQSPTYAVSKDGVQMSFVAVPMLCGDTLLVSMSMVGTGNAAAAFERAVASIQMTDTLGAVYQEYMVECPLCHQRFATMAEYMNHVCPAVYTVGTTVEYVQCPDCGRWFRAGAEYNNHVCPAKSEGYIRCPACGDWYTASDYPNHICPATVKDLVQCPDCGGWFEEGNVFRNHVCPARVRTQIMCPDCGQWYYEGDTHDCPALLKSTELVQCPDCGGWFEAGNVFRNHVCTGANESGKRIQCPDCGQWYVDGEVHNCPAANRSAGSTEYVQCPDCGEWFEAGNVFRNHVCRAKTEDWADESGKRIQCPDCGQWYVDGEVHNCPAANRSAGSTEYVQCPDCGEWFEAGNVFRNHVCRAKTEDWADESGKRIQCPDCGQWYVDGEVHNCPAANRSAGSTEYVQCPDCGEWFEAGNVFRNHVCTGANESGKRIQCPDCGQWYVDGEVHNCPAVNNRDYSTNSVNNDSGYSDGGSYDGGSYDGGGSYEGGGSYDGGGSYEGAGSYDDGGSYEGAGSSAGEE